MPVLLDERITAGSAPAAPARPGLGARYHRVWAAAAISGVGDGMLLVALPLLALRSTSDPRLVAAVAAAQRLPWLLAGLHAGAIADRTPPRRLLLGSEATRAAALLVVALVVGGTGRAPIALLLVVAAVLGTAETFFSAASATVVPDLVPDELLERANGRLFAATTAGEQLVGPALGGLAFAAAPMLPLAVDGVSFLASALLLGPAVRGLAPHAGRTAGGFLDGVRHLARHRLLRALTLATALLAGGQAAVLAVLVLLVGERAGLGPAGYGALLALAAAGNVLGGALGDRFVAGRRPAAVVVACGAVAGGCYVALGQAQGWAVLALVLAVEAVAVAVGNVAGLSLRQRLVPAALRGRTSAAIRTAIFGAMPVGAIAGGALAHAAGPSSAVAWAGAAQLVLLAGVAAPLLRRPHLDLRAA